MSITKEKLRNDPDGAKAAEEEDVVYFSERVRVYAKSVKGRMRQYKWAIMIVCLSVYYILPWLRWDRGPGRPDQALLLDMSGQRFYFFGLELWPQELYVLVGLMVIGAMLLFLVSSIIGRVWCGYSCPQTVWTDLFMLVERWIEGDRTQRIRLDQREMSFDKFWRKTAKHTVWLLIALATGGAWIFYYVDAPTTIVQFFKGTASFQVYLFTALFTATTYLLAGWAREQVCTYMCPWPRFQAAMFDEQTFTVTYQAWRGEPRGKGKKHVKYEGMGDCIDCGQCIAVCPTGIDIRDGVQLECINCGLCVDACNNIMDEVDRPRGLITWDTLANQTAKAQGTVAPLKLIRPRTLFYVTLLLIGSTLLASALFHRSMIALEAQRDRAPLFLTLRDGTVRDVYTLKVINKTVKDGQFELSLSGLDGATLQVSESGLASANTVTLPVAPDSVSTFKLFITVPGSAISGQKPVDFHMRDLSSGEQTVFHSEFVGPGVGDND